MIGMTEYTLTSTEIIFGACVMFVLGLLALILIPALAMFVYETREKFCTYEPPTEEPEEDCFIDEDEL